MSVEIITSMDRGLEREVNSFMDALHPSRGISLELDLRWLQVLRDGLRHTPYVLLNRSGTEIVGYLPLALVKSMLFGRFLVGLPYLNRAGIAARDAASATELLQTAVKLADELDVQYLELRHHALVLNNPLVTHTREDKVRMVRELPDSPEILFKAVGPKVRNQVRKGEKSGLRIKWGAETLLDDFYTVFATNMRDLGTPVYSRKLFSAIFHHFPEESELAVVYSGQQPVAGALLIHDQRMEKITQVPSASCLRAYNYTNANMWMYHQLLLRAMERGSVQFDFGRSSEGSGTYRFKKQWGAVPHPTVWQYHLRHGALDAARPDNPRMQRRIETWKKMPVWLTRLIGPGIVRGIP